jgi:hypothetical protein
LYSTRFATDLIVRIKVECLSARLKDLVVRVRRIKRRFFVCNVEWRRRDFRDSGRGSGGRNVRRRLFDNEDVFLSFNRARVWFTRVKQGRGRGGSHRTRGARRCRRKFMRHALPRPRSAYAP